MVEDLDEDATTALLDEYLSISFDNRGQSPEIGTIFRHAMTLAPGKLRVKEIIETMEVFFAKTFLKTSKFIAV